MQLTHGHLLGGRLRYAQPREGFRSGIEPVFLAASVLAKPGDRVLEGGTGAGAGLLCLAQRVENICGVGLERDPQLAVLAGRNLRDNGYQEQIHVVSARMEALPLREAVHHAFANPPYHPEVATPSAIPARNAAKRAHKGLIAAWTQALATVLVEGGTLTLIITAAILPQCLDAFAAARCGSVTLFPLWPSPGRAAKLLLMRGVKGGQGPCRLLSGLVLHESGGGFTAEADAVLRQGVGLIF